MSGNRLFCFGYGYCADHLGHALMGAGDWRLAGTTRDPDKRSAFRARGIEMHFFSEEKPLVDPAAALTGTTHLLLSIPPDDVGDPVFNHHADDILKISTLRWVGYLSSTSVYGDRDGGWVDETSPLQPNSKRGSRRAGAEAQWLSLLKERALPVHVFRLAGIYGPGRSAIEAVRAGTSRRIDKPGHAFSRIHVDDIVAVLRASMDRMRPGGIYNLADDEAAPSHELIAYACELLGLPVPPLEPFSLSDMPPMARSFYSDNKRVHNDRIKTELGVTLRYPEFRAGLRACLEAEQHPAPESAISF